jgi:hypothetical protein
VNRLNLKVAIFVYFLGFFLRSRWGFVWNMNVFFLVLSKDTSHIKSKIQELNDLKMPYVIICGKRTNYANVVYRAPNGKFDAINFGSNYIPKDVDVVVLNDVDTEICNFKKSLSCIASKGIDLVFARVLVKRGPQGSFYRILDFIRRRILICASGELMLIKRDTFEAILPLKPCKAEDSYILFKALELKRKAVFCEPCYVETVRTKTIEKEEDYKRKTVCGIYQALSSTKPPFLIRFFYFLLPFATPLLLISGRKGYFWTRGIVFGFVDFLRGDKSGSWSTTYLE